MKECKKCHRVLDDSMFEQNRHTCKDCRRDYRKQRRHEHPEIHRTQELRREKINTEWLLSQKTPCVICGENEPICIDFHHINMDEKEFTIGKHRNLSKDRLLKEISKCVCLCANCHRKIHAGLIKINNV